MIVVDQGFPIILVIIREGSFQRIPYPNGVLPVDEDGVGVAGKQLRRHTGKNGKDAKPARRIRQGSNYYVAIPFFTYVGTSVVLARQQQLAPKIIGGMEGRRRC